MSETFGWLGTWLRLLWRHWPVLLSLAAASVLIRSLLISYVLIDAARWREGLGGELAFGLLPVVMLIAMIMMLRVVRPSLPYLGPRERPDSALRHLASVAIPFVAFYVTARYIIQDGQYYGQAVAQVSFSEVLGGEESKPLPDLLDPNHPEVFAAIAAGAFVLRWIFSLLGSARSTVLGLLALYPEVMWVAAAGWASNLYRLQGGEWLARTRVYQWVGSIVDSWHLPWLTSLFPSLDYAVPMVVVPVTALIAGTTVLMASGRPRPVQASGLRRFLPPREDGPSGGPLGVLRDALRRVFRAGVVPTMVFCLAFALVRAAPGYLSELERVLIGPRDYSTIWQLIEFPLIYLNESITLVLTFSLIAAFVDRTARREARQSEPSEPTPPSGPDLEVTQRGPASHPVVPAAAVPAGFPPAPSSYGTGPSPYGQSPYGQPPRGSST